MSEAAHLLSAERVGVAYGGCPVVTDATFGLDAGKLIALVGPNGAGKTTLLRALGGLAPATGRILVAGADVARLPPRERARRIAFLPQGHVIHWPLTARDVVALGRYPHGLADPARMGARDAAIVDAALARTDASAFAGRQVSTLSGGERARVMLARVLAVEAPILLADEPTAALDPRHQIGIMAALREEARRGTLVIAVTHDLGLAARMADEVIVIDRGRLVARGEPRAVLTPTLMQDVYGVAAFVTEHAGEAVIVPWTAS